MDIAALFSLKGRSAIVTGASSGLGVTFAEVLAAAGAGVVLAARRTDKLEEVRRRIEQAGGTAVALACDVADPAQVARLMAQTAERFGRIDVLVNNAGIVPDGGMMPERLPHELFEQTIRTNLLGVWYCCREAAPYMLRDGKGGSIVNVASISGMVGLRDHPPAYQASKAAVIHLTRNLACSWGDRGVRVNALAPGWFPSEMTAGVFSMPGFLPWAGQSAAMNRVGRPEELAGALLLLASDAGSFISGSTLVVDGGLAAGGGVDMPDSVYEVLQNAVPNDMGKHIGKPAGK
jgi:NAD(P)-dependent dehydrogenase (short-subunit alcohol dehydrogenase family)